MVSKLGQVGDLNDGVDTSVPGVELSDIGDSEILSRTSEAVNPNGLFQFIFTPDDGSEPIRSDWVDQEHKKKLIRAWVDGVKGNIIARGQEKLRAANEAKLEERARRIRDEQFADPPVVDERNAGLVQKGSDPRKTAPQGTARSVVQAPMVATDPTDYVQDQLELARERLRGAEQAQSDIVREVLNARRDYEKWSALSAVLSGATGSGSGTSVEQSPSPAQSSSGNHRSSPVRGDSSISLGDVRRILNREGT